jgi:hypothetical protein
MFLQIDWAQTLAQQPGFFLSSVLSAELLDVNVSPPVAADPAEISLVSGMDVDPDPPPQPGFTNISGTVSQNMIECDEDTAIGRSYRFNIVVIARDCQGRKIKVKDCVFISVQEC